jgi:uncharacterized delta-60 repeat protein
MKNRLISLVRPLLALAFSAALVGTTSASAQSLPKLDAAFHPVITRLGGYASSVVAQSDGRLVVAGSFNAINGTARNGIARLNTDGSVDPTFDPGAGVCCGSMAGLGDITAPISAMLIQRDGRIVIGGPFSTVNGTARKGVARLNTDGSPDTTFDPGAGLGLNAQTAGRVSVVAMIEQPDGRLLIGGYFTSVNGVTRKGIARLNANGSLDATFDPGAGVPIDDANWGFGQLNALSLLGNGQILVAGSFAAFNDTPRNGLARLNANGSLDPALNVFIKAQESAPSLDGMVAQADGKIVFSGPFIAVEDDFLDNLARISASGATDLTFAPSVNVSGGESYRLLGSQADGRLVAFRQFVDANGVSSRAITRLNTDGTLDAAFSVVVEGGSANRLQILGSARQPDGKWVTAGNFTSGAHSGIVRINAAGGVDEVFNPRFEIADDLSSNVEALATQKDGKVVIGGVFERVNGVEHRLLARLNRDGSIDSSFAPVIQTGDPRSSVSAITLQDDGKILIGGVFRGVNGVSRAGIARLNTDGSVDMAFDPGAGTNEKNVSGFDLVGRVSAIAVRPDGKILAGGDFTIIHDTGTSWLALLNADGSVDANFSPSLKPCRDCSPPDIRGIALLSDGHIMIRGLFDRVQGFTVNGLARLDSDGYLMTAFFPPISTGEEVPGIAVSADDKTVAAVLSFDTATGLPRGRLLRFKPDGTLDADFKPGTAVGGGSQAAPISALGMDADGRLLFGGALTAIGDTARSGLARIQPDGTLDSGFDAGAVFSRGVLNLSSVSRSLVTGIAFQDDGGIIVAGAFASFGGQARLGLARFQAEPPGQGGGGGGGGGGVNPAIRSPARAADGTFSMSVSGEAGRVYRVEASDDLKAWTALGTVTGAATSQPFSDPAAKTLTMRFYRLRAQ